MYLTLRCPCPTSRRLLTNTPAQLPSPITRRRKKSSGSAYTMRTLSTVSPTSCTNEILEKMSNLKKLGIRGNLVELMETHEGTNLFDNLQELSCLKNLKLLHETINNGEAGHILRRFPRANKFPPRLRKLTLSNTPFEWKDFSVLGELYGLEVLKLEENAFRGDVCDVSNVVFKCLQYLRIGRNDLVSWIASKDSFPALKSLVLRNCNRLDAVPLAFGEVESLKMMNLYCTTKMAANSARKVRDLKTSEGGFELSIHPPDH